MKKSKIVLLMMFVMVYLFAVGCEPPPDPPPDPNPVLGEMTDSRDGQTYKTVTLGDQTWLAQDLNYETDSSRCYDDKPENCETYGRLYDWEASLTVCPDGWHLGSDEEWATLIKYLDPDADTQADSSVVEESIWAGGIRNAGRV